jgi:hypothetical protein
MVKKTTLPIHGPTKAEERVSEVLQWKGDDDGDLIREGNKSAEWIKNQHIRYMPLL